MERQLPFIEKLANIESSLISDPAQKPENAAVAVAGNVEIFVNLEGIAGAGERKAKIEKELARLEKEIAFCDKKLTNERFVKNAPADVVDKYKAKKDKYLLEAGKLREHL